MASNNDSHNNNNPGLNNEQRPDSDAASGPGAAYQYPDASKTTSTVAAEPTQSIPLESPPPYYVNASLGPGYAAPPRNVIYTTTSSLQAHQPSQQQRAYYSAGQQYVIVQQQPTSSDMELESRRQTALIFSIMSLFCCCLCCAIPAVILASRRPPYATKSTYKNAIILACVALVLGVLWVIISSVVRTSVPTDCGYPTTSSYRC